MKILHQLLFAALLLNPLSVPARENPYDTLAKLLMPFVQLLAQDTKSPNRAVAMSLHLEAMSNLPPELAGAAAEIALEYPDKLRVRAPVLGEDLTITRRGQQLWAAPGDRAAALLQLADGDRQLPALDKKFKLQPFRLPFPEKQLVFMPALFQVRSAGEEAVQGETCQVLDLELMPELARSADVAGWTARVWVRKNGRPARLLLAREDWRIQVRFDRVDFSPSLPPETWAPPADALSIPPARYKQLLDAMTSARAKDRAESPARREAREE